MRLAGYRRGNSAVRFMVEQSARRRMCSAHTLEPDEAEGARMGTVQRWSRAFFEQLHTALLPRMAHVADTPEGQLRYFGSNALSVWAFVSQHATALAYEHADSPVQIRERSHRWLACLSTRTAPGLASTHWGDPVYGARLDPFSGELDVVWAVPGDWCDRVLAGALPEREWDAPRSWAAGRKATSPGLLSSGARAIAPRLDSR